MPQGSTQNQVKTMQKTIIKLEPRVEVTPSGATRTVYRRREYKPGHPDYEKEWDLMQQAADANRSKPLPLIPTCEI